MNNGQFTLLMLYLFIIVVLLAHNFDKDMNIFKWLSIPSGEKVEVKAYKTWVVRWHSRHGSFSGDTKPEAEIFTTKEDADKFAGELQNAFKLIRHTSGTLVKVEDNNLYG